MKTQFEMLAEDPEFRRLVSIETLTAEAAELIARLMAEQKVTKADLARRLNKSRAWVTQMLSGKANLTVRTLAEVAHALDAEVRLETRQAAWRAKKQSGDQEPRRVAFQLNHYVMEQPAKVFTQRTNLLSPIPADAGGGPTGEAAESEYAA